MGEGRDGEGVGWGTPLGVARSGQRGEGSGRGQDSEGGREGRVREWARAGKGRVIVRSGEGGGW